MTYEIIKGRTFLQDGKTYGKIQTYLGPKANTVIKISDDRWIVAVGNLDASLYTGAQYNPYSSTPYYSWMLLDVGRNNTITKYKLFIPHEQRPDYLTRADYSYMFLTPSNEIFVIAERTQWIFVEWYPYKTYQEWYTTNFRFDLNFNQKLCYENKDTTMLMPKYKTLYNIKFNGTTMTALLVSGFYPEYLFAYPLTLNISNGTYNVGEWARFTLPTSVINTRNRINRTPEITQKNYVDLQGRTINPKIPNYNFRRIVSHE
jgi:hypothetical protein